MARLRSPAGRLGGSFVSWSLFAFSFAGFAQATGSVVGLGGYCAWGGPYAIASRCPDAVALFGPLGLLGMLVAAVIGLVVAGSFGTPLVLWAWPAFFVAIGVQFLVGAASGLSIVTNVLVGLLALVMGVVPWWWMIRSGAQPFLLGTADLHGRPFAYQEGRTGRSRSIWAPKRGDGEPVPARPSDWALALGVFAVAAVLGGVLGILAFNGVSGGA